MENKVKEKESKTDSIFLWPWCQRIKNQLGTEVGDKQEGNYRKFSGRRHHIFFLPAFRFDGKMERFGLAAFQKKCYKLTSSWHTLKCSSCTIHKAAWSNKQKNKRKKRKEKTKKHPVFVCKTQGGKAIMNIWHMHVVLWYTQSLTGIWLWGHTTQLHMCIHHMQPHFKARQDFSWVVE